VIRLNLKRFNLHSKLFSYFMDGDLKIRFDLAN